MSDDFDRLAAEQTAATDRIASLAENCDRLVHSLKVEVLRNTELQNEISRLTEKLAVTILACQGAERQLERHRHMRRKLTNSVSWQLTRPLRALVSIGKRAFEYHADRGLVSASTIDSSDITHPSATLLPLALRPFTSYASPEQFRPMPENLRAVAASGRVYCRLVHLYYVELLDELPAILTT